MATGIINAAEKSRFRDTEDELYKKRENIIKNTSRLVGTQTKKKMMEFLYLAFLRRKDKNEILNIKKMNKDNILLCKIIL